MRFEIARSTRAAVALVVVLAAAGVVSAPARAARVDAITYDSHRTDRGGPGIWTMERNGHDQHLFVAGGTESSWSLDGTRMIYSASEGDPHCLASGGTGGAITLVNENGKKPKVLTGACGDARISPDGRHVVFEPSADTMGVIPVAHPNAFKKLIPTLSGACGRPAPAGGDPHTGRCAFATEPSWAGDSKVVYSTDTASAGGGLWSVPISGGEPSAFADGPPDMPINYGISGLAIDPANPSAAAASTQLGADTNDSIYLIPAGGSTGPKIATAPKGHNYTFPQWSPDGRNIVFEDDFGQKSVVRIIALSGGSSVILTPKDHTARNPAFVGHSCGLAASAGTGRAVAAEAQCCALPVVTATAHVERGGGGVSVKVIARRLRPRCGRARLSWNSPFGDGAPLHILRRTGSELIGTATARGAHSCFTKLTAKVVEGGAEATKEANVRDGLPIIAAVAKRTKSGLLKIRANATKLRSVAACGRGEIAASATRGPAHFSKLTRPASNPTVGSARLTERDCSAIRTLLILHQDAIDVEDSVPVSGEPATVCMTGP